MRSAHAGAARTLRRVHEEGARGDCCARHDRRHERHQVRLDGVGVTTGGGAGIAAASCVNNALDAQQRLRARGLDRGDGAEH